MVMFAVPAGIGTKELGRVLVFQALDFPASSGAAFALILRAEELFFAFLGLIIYLSMVPKEKRASRTPKRGKADACKGACESGAGRGTSV